MVVKVSKMKSALEKFQFLKSENDALRQLENEQVRSDLRGLLAINMYATEEGRFRKLFLRGFCKRNSPLTLLCGAYFRQLALYRYQAKAHLLSSVIVDE